MNKRLTLVLILAIQVACAGVFIAQILINVLPLDIGPIQWVYYELTEIGAVIGLSMGSALGVVALRSAWARTERAEAALRQARAAFRDVLEEHFSEWDLTPAERDVALFAIKGFSTADIANLRGVSEGTIKAQTNAIYRKAGVSGRSQLLSLFIDDLIEADDAADG